MHNANIPPASELPSAAQLVRSTVIAAAAAAILLVTVVMPAEHGIDPTGMGQVLGLTEMGEIREQLAHEAEAEAMAAARADQDDRLKASEKRPEEVAVPAAPSAQPQEVQASPATVAEAPPVPPAVAAWTDEISVTLAPGQGVEYKLVMAADAEAEFEWSATDGALNFDTHGDARGKSISYEKGRGVASDAGILKAAFDGNHGWFWRNRTDQPVTLTLRTRGDYSEFKRTS